MPITRLPLCLLLLTLHGAMSAAAAADSTNDAARLAMLEDRESIRLVLRDYGRLLDERRFDEFGQLFTADGEYVAGVTTRGPAAIADGLRRQFAGNPMGLREPNFHVLFNERITLQGDRASASSQSFFVAPGADGAPRIVMMASYRDELVRTPSGWRFAKRIVKGELMASPAAAAAPPPAR